MMIEIRHKYYWEIPAMCDFLHLFFTISYQQSSPPLRFAHKSQGMNLLEESTLPPACMLLPPNISQFFTLSDLWMCSLVVTRSWTMGVLQLHAAAGSSMSPTSHLPMPLFFLLTWHRAHLSILHHSSLSQLILTYYCVIEAQWWD